MVSGVNVRGRSSRFCRIITGGFLINFLDIAGLLKAHPSIIETRQQVPFSNLRVGFGAFSRSICVPLKAEVCGLGIFWRIFWVLNRFVAELVGRWVQGVLFTR